jgi:hypothetical protein
VKEGEGGRNKKSQIPSSEVPQFKISLEIEGGGRNKKLTPLKGSVPQFKIPMPIAGDRRRRGRERTEGRREEGEGGRKKN